jgi:hypothetical protein
MRSTRSVLGRNLLIEMSLLAFYKPPILHVSYLFGLVVQQLLQLIYRYKNIQFRPFTPSSSTSLP